MGGKILVVDDDPDALDCLDDALRDRFDVVLASGGAEALACIANDSFDAILLDLSMPEVDGFDVLSALKQRGCSAPVLLTSARPELAKLAARMEADGWIAKPYRLDVVERKLLGLMAGSGARPPSSASSVSRGK